MPGKTILKNIAWLLIAAFVITTPSYTEGVSLSVSADNHALAVSPLFERPAKSDSNFFLIAFAVAEHLFADRLPERTLIKSVRDKFRGNPEALELLRSLLIAETRDNAICLRYPRADGIYDVWACLPENIKEESVPVLPAGQSWVQIGPFGFSASKVALAPKADNSEPLIGHGFKYKDLAGVKVTTWEDSPEFINILESLEDTISSNIKEKTLRDRLLTALFEFRSGKSGKRLGTVKSRYLDSAHYYLGFGTSASLALAGEFLRDPCLNKYAEEALFHELFHAAHSVGQNGREIGADSDIHFDALRLAAVIYWGLDEKRVANIHTIEALEHHSANALGRSVRKWKEKKENVRHAMVYDDSDFLLDALRASLAEARSRKNTDALFNLLSSCDEASRSNPRYTNEARYPILRAVTRLNKRRKDELLAILLALDNEKFRDLTVTDSIILMLKKDVPDDWIRRQAPGLTGRRVWQVSSEIWNAGGGLGRVMQFHGLGMRELLRKTGSSLCHIEPYYETGTDRKTGKPVELDYAAMLGVSPEGIEEIDRFKVGFGKHNALAVCYKATNKHGIETYLIKGFRGENEKIPYYTRSMYEYRSAIHPDSVGIEEFAAFFSLASAELIRRREAKRRIEEGNAWKAPVSHFNDGQLGLAPYFIEKRFSEDPAFKRGLVAYTTHTFPNRIFFEETEDEGGILDYNPCLRAIGIPYDDELRYFHHRMRIKDRNWIPIADITSAGLRTADWINGVSGRHVDELLDDRKYDENGKWGKIPGRFVAVTNGDLRPATAKRYRDIMKGLFGNKVDAEEPTPKQTYATNREAKKELNKLLGLDFDPELPVLSYTGRGVDEKIGGQRALSDKNIIELVKMGVQVIIGANKQTDFAISERLSKLYRTIQSEKKESPSDYRGNFVFLEGIDLEGQRAILAASDVQVQDSDPSTEAAGYSEADIGVCGGLQVAPPWKEGILQAQGILINPDTLGNGRGNVFVPELREKIQKDDYEKLQKGTYDTAFNEKVGKAYLELFRNIFDRGGDSKEVLNKLSSHQARAVRLSRVIDARNTSAEYLRQFSKAIEEKERRMLDEKVIMRSTGKTLERLEEEGMREWLESLYGKSYEETPELTGIPGKADLAFERIFEKKDGKKTGKTKEMVNRVGWTLPNVRWTLDHKDALQDVLNDARAIRDGGFKYVIFCGMGGSGLSVQFVRDTFGKKADIKLFSLRTTDPGAIRDILNEIKASEDSDTRGALGKTLIIPISKSGKTEETRTHIDYFTELYKSLELDIKKHMRVITDKGSPISGLGEQKEIQLNGKADIGGRYTSPTTRIFLLPLALVAPQRITPILERAKAMNDAEDIEKDTFTRLGVFLYLMAREYGRDKLTLLVPDELRQFPMWSEQLLEESLGKDGKGITLFYDEGLSPADLKKPEKDGRVFVRINVGQKRPGEKLWQAVSEDVYPKFEINMESLQDTGGLMLGFQRAVATFGYLWDICFIDQPAVEDYKEATTALMNAARESGKPVDIPEEWQDYRADYGKLSLYYLPLLEAGGVSDSDLEAEVKRLGSDMADAACVYAAILNLLINKPGFEAAELTTYCKMTPEAREILKAARKDIFTRGFRMPSKLGEGPDKNHSYQQNLEAGKNMFFSTYILPMAFRQPEELKYDTDLIKAQAIGTVNSMKKKKRKAVLITSKKSIDESAGDIDRFFADVRKYLDIPDSRENKPAVETERDWVRSAKNAAKAIHYINKDLLPPVEAGKTVYYLIHEGLIPISIRDKFKSLLNKMDDDFADVREKIRIVEAANIESDIARYLGEDGIVNIALSGK